MIIAGDISGIQWGIGNWVFLDVGFSSKSKSCGLIIGDSDPECLQFFEAGQKILTKIAESKGEINVLIEAPLSVCFSPDGNPKGRSIEREGNQTRYWYVGSGCAVMVAATYIIRKIQKYKPSVPVYLFEGFISYKKRKTKSDHKRDVELLKEVVLNPSKFRECIVSPDQLRIAPQDHLLSAFDVMGLNCGIPPVIRRRIGYSA